jgi:hypothetical protein
MTIWIWINIKQEPKYLVINVALQHLADCSADPTSPRREASLFNLPGTLVPGIFLPESGCDNLPYSVFVLVLWKSSAQ